jgi:hypothetical protein
MRADTTGFVACLEPMLRRRQLLAASAATAPAFLSLGTLSACAGPNPLAGPPPLSADVRSVLAAVTTELNLIVIYNASMARYSKLAPALRPLLAEHQAHLAQLRARIVEPPGKSVPSRATRRPRVPASEQAAVAQIQSAERAAVTASLRRLRSASPSLAQLYASIAASDATHASVLAKA